MFIVPVDRKVFAQIKLILYRFIVDLRLLLNSVLTRGQTCTLRESVLLSWEGAFLFKRGGSARLQTELKQ